MAEDTCRMGAVTFRSRWAHHTGMLEAVGGGGGWEGREGASMVIVQMFGTWDLWVLHTMPPVYV